MKARSLVLVALLCLGQSLLSQSTAGEHAANASVSPATHPAPAKAVSAPASPDLVKDYGKLPLSFEANQGQMDPEVRFSSHGNGYSLYLTDTAAVMALSKGSPETQGPAGLRLPGKTSRASQTHPKTDIVRMELVGANAGTPVEGTGKLPGTANYFIGNDSSKWHSNVPTYAKVKYTGVYPGVDLVYYGNQRQLEYDFVVAPHADPNPIALHFAGAKKLTLTPEGDLTVTAKNGEIAFHKPVIYQMKGGQRLPVQGQFTLSAKSVVHFALGDYDHARELVVDPILAYSTYLGGCDPCYARYGVQIAVDAFGSAYLGGTVGLGTSIPVTAGAIKGTNNATPYTTAFITKFNPEGTALIYSTYLGGSGYPLRKRGDTETGMAVDSEGNAYLTGQANSLDFPVTGGAFEKENSHHGKGYVTKINPSGTALVYSTFLGGSSALPQGDAATAIAVDSHGDAYVNGTISSTNFPLSSNPYSVTGSAFLTELNPRGSGILYSTRLNLVTYVMTLDPDGNVYLLSGIGHSAAIYKFNAQGTGYVYTKLLGGTNGSTYASSLTVDDGGEVYVAGSTSSTNFPTTPGVLQTKNNAIPGRYNGFVTKLSSNGTFLVYSTYLGGTGYDEISGIKIDSLGEAYVVGSSDSQSFPITSNAIQQSNNSTGSTGFVAKLNPDASALIYSTYLGGSSGGDGVSGIAVDLDGDAYVTGYTQSSDFPITAGAYQTTYNGEGDSTGASAIFVSKLSLSANSLPLPSATSLTASVNPATVGASVTFTAFVEPIESVQTPIGTVTFSIDGQSVAVVNLDDTDHAVYTAPALGVFRHKVVATYTSANDFLPSSATVTEVIEPTSLDFNHGFAGPDALIQANGSAAISGSQLLITSGLQNQTGSGFYSIPINIQSFTTDFSFLLSNPAGDGFTFTIQNSGPTALGGMGGSLGYASINKSVAIKFDLYNDLGEGPDSTGLYINGVAPKTPAINLANTGINLHSGDPMSVHITYNVGYSGGQLDLTIIDQANNAMWSNSFAVDIPATVGGATAYVGFTGSTGAQTSTQAITSWAYETGSATP